MNRATAIPHGQTFGLVIGLALGFFACVKANAQWLPDRAYNEGPGIKVGELELHPGVAIRGGYNSNVFRSDGAKNGGQPIRDAAVLAVTPHLFLSTEGAQRSKEGEDRSTEGQRFIGFRGGVSATYLHFFINDGPRNLAVDTDLMLAIGQGRPVEVDITAGYLRSVAPFTENAQSRTAYAYDTIDPSIRVKFGSRILNGFVGYVPRYTFYESRFFDYLTNIQHGIEWGAAWRFLPSTALIYDGRLALQYYTQYDSEDRQLLLLSNNQIFRSRFGINGAVTESIKLRALAGYAVGFFKNRELDDFEDVIGEAVFTYNFGPHAWELGYQRDVQSSPLGAWYQTDRGFTKLSFLFAQIVALSLEGGVAHANYGRLVRVFPDGSVHGLGVNRDMTEDSSREDIRVDGALRAEYRITTWLALMADVTVQSILTDFKYDVSRVGDRVIADPAKYTVVQAFGGVRAHY